MPLVEVRRGGVVESRHRGHVVAVEPGGQLVAELGAPEMVTFLRSSAKPFQALPLVASGAAARFGFTDDEIAIACGSHSGEPLHEATVAGMLRKIGLDESALKCGIHEPFNVKVAHAMREHSEPFRVLQNNCSGKHAGLLALALHLGAPVETYDEFDHPVQQAIARTVAEFADVPLAELAVGIDGCGVPVFGLPVRAMALMYARLVAPPVEFGADVRAACARIVQAVTTHPELVGGAGERLDTEVMRATRGRVVSKIGAEGVYTAGVRPSDEWPRGLGLALKIEDGENLRARPTVVVEALRQLGVLDAAASAALMPYARFDVRNNRGELVGEVCASFRLEKKFAA